MDLDELKTYLQIAPNDTSEDDELTQILVAETAAQDRVCRVADPMPADLAEALKRRVARNRALRQLAVMTPRGDGEAGPVVLPGRDPEVRRLEAPHRKLVMG
ncbi:hypothetical protein [Actinoplanes sp. M2I2]|uniref:hypothetical protein n=1 Tax=Actinoplanes sp. M2I2 TaxID=1734444 RepID=UPI0020216DEE|nr:hypothetical protein [Actinoplanes sp. M2I2]